MNTHLPQKLIAFVLLTLAVVFLFGVKLQIVSQAVDNRLAVYDDQLQSSWHDWSWQSRIFLDSHDQVKSGQNSLYFSPSPWGGLYLHTDQSYGLPSVTHLEFSLFSFSPSHQFNLYFYNPDGQVVSSAFLNQNNGWQTHTVALPDQSISGFSLQEATGLDQPAFYLDDISFIKATDQPAIPTPSSMATPATFPNNLNSGYYQQNGQIFYQNQPVRFRGISWFGFETGTHVVHGLWARNWQDMISQIKQTGFNAVRIPFCPATLQNTAPASIDYDLNPDLQGLNSLDIFDQIMAEFNRQQMYILLDHHTIDCQNIPQLWYADNYSQDDWISDLKFVASRYSHLPYFMGIDLKNEPHGQATWGTGNSTDWRPAAQLAGQAVLSANPNLLIFVQGVQENPDCSGSFSHWMGGNLEPQRCYPLDLPQSKLVFSPHVYGPDVYPQGYFSAPDFPLNLPSIWDQHFGFLVDQGFAVVPGEWGGQYGLKDPKDKAWQDTIVNYFKQKGITSHFYWSWNPNSGDTGGILLDDWSTVNQDKINLLNQLN